MDWHTLQTSVPAAIAAFCTVVGALVGVAIKCAQFWRAVRDKRMKSVPPVAPLPQPNGWFADPSITGKIHEANVSIARSEWALSELRDELRQCREERDQVAQDARRTADALVRTEVELRSALAKLATLEQAKEHWQREAARLESEVERLSARQRVERVNPDSVITPLRPPGQRRET